MNDTFRLQVLTPAGVLLETETDSAQLPAVDGSLGILAGHAPMIAGLASGAVRYRQDGDWRELAIPGGTAEVSKNGLLVLTYRE